MKIKILFVVLAACLSVAVCSARYFDDHPTLAIGSKAPPFSLKGVDGKIYTLASFSKYNILVVIFTCNHCPTAQAYEDRIKKLVTDYSPKNVAFAVISGNDPLALRLDEMDFSDLGDSYEEMKIRAKDKQFNFPYLYDGETQKVTRAYGPVATPHVFVFDKERKLRYVGRVDDTEWPHKEPQTTDARNAIEALLKDDEGRLRMGVQGSHYARERLTWRLSAQKLLACYNQVLSSVNTENNCNGS